jgi:hypothetical protein
MVPLTLGFCLAFQANADDVGVIEKAALDARRAIVRGEMEMDSSIWTFPSAERKLVYQTRKKLWFDGDKTRTDTIYQLAGNYREVQCIADAWFTSWSSQVLSGRSIVMRRLALKSNDLDIGDVQIDPRAMGMAPRDSPNLVHHHLESFIARPDRKAPTIRKESLDSIDCWRIEYLDFDGFTVRYWIAPSLGHNVMRMDFSFRNQEIPYVDSVRCDVRKHESSGIWFPVSCHYQRHEDDKLTVEEKLTLHILRLNSEVDPSVFTIKAMDIRPGITIFQDPPDPRGETYWNGSDIVPHQVRSPVVASKARALKESQTRFWIAAALLGVISLLALLRYYKKRHVPRMSN